MIRHFAHAFAKAQILPKFLDGLWTIYVYTKD